MSHTLTDYCAFCLRPLGTHVTYHLRGSSFLPVQLFNVCRENTGHTSTDLPPWADLEFHRGVLPPWLQAPQEQGGQTMPQEQYQRILSSSRQKSSLPLPSPSMLSSMFLPLPTYPGCCCPQLTQGWEAESTLQVKKWGGSFPLHLLPAGRKHQRDWAGRGKPPTLQLLSLAEPIFARSLAGVGRNNPGGPIPLASGKPETKAAVDGWGAGRGRRGQDSPSSTEPRGEGREDFLLPGLKKFPGYCS